jgi:predicted transcriptional regulator
VARDEDKRHNGIDLGFQLLATGEVEVDDATLAAIDRGIEAAQAGRCTSLEELRKIAQMWTSKSESPNRR